MKHLSLLLGATLLCGAAFGQTNKPSQTNVPTILVTGTIYDIQGSVVAGGVVTAKSPDGKHYNVLTNDEGTYKLELPPAVYDLSARREGFCPTRVEGFTVVNSTFGKMNLDLVLDVAKSGLDCNNELIIKRKPPKRSQKTPNKMVVKVS